MIYRLTRDKSIGRKKLTSLIFLFFLFPISLFSEEIPSFDSIRKSYLNSDLSLYDYNGFKLHTIRINPQKRQLNWIPVEKIPSHLTAILILAEDKRFHEHEGVDYIALLSAFKDMLLLRNKRGASTITMQLVSFLFPSLISGSSGRSISQKLKQISLAKALEERWSKRGILEAYLNLASYRGELKGIDAAARGLFRKDSSSLNQLESIILISLLKNPQASRKRITQRACYIASKLEQAPSCAKLQEKVHKIKKNYYIPQEEFFIPHLAERVRQEHKKFLSQKRKLYLSVDRKIQIYALELVKQHMFFVKEKNVNDAALLVLENSSGKILAYVGGSGEFSEAKYVDNILTRRQAGSTLKPFLYALAFEKNILTPESILNDTPTEFQTERGVYKPGNYQNSFFGKVSVKKALASSLNIPAVKTLSLVGERDFNITLKSLGFSNLENPEFYGLSAALGSPDISLEELTNAYRVLANRGKYSPVHYLRESKQEKYSMVFSVQSSELISEILSSRENRALTFGLENPLSTRFWSAVKTGTSKDMRDNWCIGYTKDYTVGVWVGNSSGKPMWNVSGVTGAAPLWIDMVNWLSSRKHPNSLSENTTINSTNENEQKKAIPKIPFQNGIETPVDNTIIAIDPDIPDENQRVFFKSVFPDPSSYWYLNGKKLGDASSTYFWKPERGSFTLELYTKDKQLLSRVSFSVR